MPDDRDAARPRTISRGSRTCALAPDMLVRQRPDVSGAGSPTSHQCCLFAKEPTTMRLRSSLLLAALPLAAACGASDVMDNDEGWLPEGKADEVAVPLRYNSYDVLFTNPLCREYTYATPVKTADGSKTLTAKPKNVYCSHTDMAASAARPSSPQNKLLTWITPLGAGDEIFLAYLSFSNSAIGDAL